MKYGQFKKIFNIDLFLLLSLKALKSSQEVFELDHFPDYDLTGYDKHADHLYVFFDDLDFPPAFDTILNITHQGVRLFNWDDINAIRKEFDLIETERDTYASVLSEARPFDQDLNSRGEEIDFDGFHLKDVRVTSINNIQKCINVLGSYVADSSWIEPLDGKLIFFCEILGIPSASTTKKLFIGLLAEGYSLLLNKNNTLAFLMLYTALENFIVVNQATPNEEIRLSEKLQKLFRRASASGELNNHLIYSSLSGLFDDFTAKRNVIAHGLKPLKVSTEEVREILLFTLTLMASIELKVETFKKLRVKIGA